MPSLCFNFDYVGAGYGAISCDNLPIYFNHASFHKFLSLPSGAHSHSRKPFTESFNVAEIAYCVFIDEIFQRLLLLLCFVNLWDLFQASLFHVRVHKVLVKSVKILESFLSLNFLYKFGSGLCFLRFLLVLVAL